MVDVATCYQQLIDERRLFKAAFHDADIDTDILARMSVSVSLSWNAAFSALGVQLCIQRDGSDIAHRAVPLRQLVRLHLCYVVMCCVDRSVIYE